MERHVLTRAQQSLRPEIFARITEKLVFNRLSYDDQIEIARLLLAGELRFLKQLNITLESTPAVLPFLVRRGFHPRLGARPMRDAVEKLIGDAVAESILHGNTTGGSLSVSEPQNCLVIC